MRAISVPKGEAEGIIEGQGETKLTVFHATGHSMFC